MNDKPRLLVIPNPSPEMLLAVAHVAAAEAGDLYVRNELVEALDNINVRKRAGIMPTAAEIEWIENELKLTPGYSQWAARQMLDRTLNGKKGVCLSDRGGDGSNLGDDRAAVRGWHGATSDEAETAAAVQVER